MTQPEINWIGAGSLRQLIHEAFQRKHVQIGTQPAQRGNPQWHVLDEVPKNVLPRNVVEGHCVPITVTGGVDLLSWLWRGRGVCELPRRQQRASRSGSSGVGVRPNRIVPARYLAIISDRGANLALHCGAVRLEEMLLFPGPLNPYRHAWRRPGYDGRIRRSIVSAVVAVATGPLYVNASHLIER